MDIPDKTTLINVCIRPNESVADECEQLSAACGSETTMFTLGGDKFAHMTVYMARFSDGEIEGVVDDVKRIAEKAQNIECEHTGYFMTEGRYLEASYRKNSSFMLVHDQIIRAVMDKRFNAGEPFEEGYFGAFTPEQQASAEETGYDLAYELYRPHITLTRYKEGMLPAEFPGFSPANLDFIAHRLCVYKADENGAVFEEIASFDI